MLYQSLVLNFEKEGKIMANQKRLILIVNNGVVYKVDVVTITDTMVCHCCRKKIFNFPDIVCLGYCKLIFPGITLVHGQGVMHTSCAGKFVRDIQLNQHDFDLLISPMAIQEKPTSN